MRSRRALLAGLAVVACTGCSRPGAAIDVADRGVPASAAPAEMPRRPTASDLAVPETERSPLVSTSPVAAPSSSDPVAQLPAPSPTSIHGSSIHGSAVLPGGTLPPVSPPSTGEPVASTEPAGTEVDAVTPVLQLLVDRHDAAVAAVLADPRLVNDPESSLVAEYLALFTADNPFPLEVIEVWKREAEQGRRYLPGPAGALRTSTVMAVTPVSADEVEFLVCIANSVVIVDEAGEPLESLGGIDSGVLLADRVGGVWLLRDLSLADPAECALTEVQE